MRGFSFRDPERPPLDLRALLMAGLAVRELHRRDPSVNVADHMARLGEAYADSTAAIIDALIDATEREQRFVHRFRSWRKRRARRSAARPVPDVSHVPPSHSPGRASHSSRGSSHVFDLASDESRPEDSEIERRWDESRAEDSESDRGSDACGDAWDESRSEDSESDARSHSSNRGGGQLVRAARAPLGGAKASAIAEATDKAPRGYRQVVTFRGLLVRIPSWMRAVPLGLACPQCGYNGERPVNTDGSHRKGCFVTKHTLEVYHVVLGAGIERDGSPVLFIDRASYEEGASGLSERGELLCANCGEWFPLPYGVLDVSVVDS